MSREDVTKLLMMIQAAYPNYKPQDKTLTVNVWYEMLKEYDSNMAMLALKSYIISDISGFAPSIGQVIWKIDEVTRNSKMQELESMLLSVQENYLETRETTGIYSE